MRHRESACWLLLLLLFAGLTSGFCLAEDYYPFDASIHARIPEVIRWTAGTDGQITNARLPISAKGGRLVDQLDRPIQLWGTGIRLTRKLLLSDHEKKQELLRNIVAQGFNQLRFVGLDFDDPGIYEHWIKNKRFDEKLLRGFCELITLSNDYGLVYSIGINHITSKYTPDKSIGYNKFEDKSKTLKLVQLYDTQVISQSKAWVAAILGEELPGCNGRLAKSPRLYYINIVNEDSLFQDYFRKFNHLSPKNIAYLETLFAIFLKDKYLSIDQLKMHWGAVNSKEIEWGISASLCPLENNGTSRRVWCSDTMEFLTAIERNYYSQLTEAIVETGYSGIITGTNNWYGYFNRDLMAETFEALNTHIYFDPPRKKKMLNGRYEVIKNFSFTNSPFDFDSWESNHINRLFVNLVYQKPLIISEWNHAKWSKNAHQGPILLMVAAKVQGIQAMSVHTYLPNADPIANRYSVIGNPVLYALMPSMAKGFRAMNDWSKESKIIGNYLSDSNWPQAKSLRYRPEFIDDALPVQQGFVTRLRAGRKIVKISEDSLLKKDAASLVSEDGVLAWDWSEAGSEYFVVNLPAFSAVVGKPDKAVKLGGLLEVQPLGEGAVSIVALDADHLESGSKFLITTVSGFKNTGQELLSIGAGRLGYTVIKNPGTSPQFLRKNPVEIKVEAAVLSLVPIGTSSLDFLSVTNGKVRLGDHNTPWYILEINRKK